MPLSWAARLPHYTHTRTKGMGAKEQERLVWVVCAVFVFAGLFNMADQSQHHDILLQETCSGSILSVFKQRYDITSRRQHNVPEIDTADIKSRHVIHESRMVEKVISCLNTVQLFQTFLSVKWGLSHGRTMDNFISSTSELHDICRLWVDAANGFLRMGSLHQHQAQSW